MYTSDYKPTFELDEWERINTIKQHLSVGDINYLYHEFDFEENEDIIDGYFDEYDQLHIIYNTTEPEDLEEYEDEEIYTDEAKDDYEFIQYELTDTERLDYWVDYLTNYKHISVEQDVTIENFWNRFESLDSDEIEEFTDYIKGN